MKLAMIGSYGHTSLVLNHLDAAPGVRLVAAARYGPEDAMAFVGKHPATRDLPVYDDYRAMLDEQRPDLVSVCMPLYRNAEASLAAIARGCHVFSEKPLATEPDDLAALRAAAGRAGVQVVAMLATRGEPAFQALHKAVAAGRIGTPVLASAQKSYPYNDRDAWYARRETYGGSIPWQAIHAVDFTAYCTGRRFAWVAAGQGNAAHPDRPGMEDHGAILLGLAGGGEAVVTFDYLRPWGGHRLPWGDDRLRIAGTEAVVETLDHGRAARLLTREGFEELPLGPERSLFGEFVASLAGQGQGLITMDESFAMTEVCLLARQAADEARRIDLPTGAQGAG